MKNLFLFLVVSFCFVSCAQNKTSKPDTNLPLEMEDTSGYVPNAGVAAKIAENIWLPIYGDDVLKYKPYKAELKNGRVWVVTGTLSEGIGGVPYIEIEKSDCKVLIVTHGK